MEKNATCAILTYIYVSVILLFVFSFFSLYVCIVV
nr:MAG TPA: hypothetical protein [Caudoviricetes sp.]